MSQLNTINDCVPAMTDGAIDKVRTLESHAMAMPQVDIHTSHVIHAGMYHRTIMIPAGVMLTGALVKIPTTVTICGNCVVYVGDSTMHVSGYRVLPASAGRKQAFVAVADTWITMSFATQAKTIEQAESEFTDELELLMSRRGDLNEITITGE